MVTWFSSELRRTLSDPDGVVVFTCFAVIDGFLWLEVPWRALTTCF
jgi:hypothetical protein